MKSASPAASEVNLGKSEVLNPVPSIYGPPPDNKHRIEGLNVAGIPEDIGRFVIVESQCLGGLD